jgi:hypothetical protein
MVDRDRAAAEAPDAAPRPDALAGPGPGKAAPRPAKKRPDPRPMRVVFGVSGIAAAAAMATAIVRAPGGPPTLPVIAEATARAAPAASGVIEIQHVTKYVQLQPGQTAPPGATVVEKAAASPRTIIVTVPAPTRAPRPVVVRVPRAPGPVVVTRQSGSK